MAAPNPEDELARVRRLAKAGLPPLVVVCGPDGFFRAEAMALLLAAVPPAAELVTIEGLEVRAPGGRGAEADADEDADLDGGDETAPVACAELQQLCSRGLFAASSVLCVRRGDNWLKRHGDAVLATLPKVQKGSSLLLEAQKLDRRTKAGKALGSQGQLFEFRELYDSHFGGGGDPLTTELVRWVTGRAKAMAVALTPESAWLLVSAVGKAPADLLAELERLRDQLGADPKRPPLPPAALRGKVSLLFESTPFELCDALLDGDRQKALRSVRAMADRGVRRKDGGSMDPGGVFPFATSWIHSALAMLYDAREAYDRGTPLRELVARAGNPRNADAFERRLQRLPLPRLRRGLLALLYVQRLLRSAGEDPDALLERFLTLWFGDAPIPDAAELEW